MIDIKNVTYRYRRGPEALTEISATLGEGVWLLLGENGAGKTTLIHTIAGLLLPQIGQVDVNGVNVATRRPGVISSIAILTDNYLFPASTINEYSVFNSPFYPTFDAEVLRSNLEAFGMTGNEQLGGMSMGTRKKAQLAYTLALRTPVILLDEPTIGLDIDSRKIFRRLLASNEVEGQTVIVSTHQTDDLGPLYSGVMIINRSRLLLSMTTDEILSHLDFGVTPVPDRSALYFEQDLGRFRTITANTTGEPQTDCDFALLYSAVMSSARDAVMSNLKPSAKQ